MVPREVGVFDAKTHLSELLEEVRRGQVIYLTKRGQRVAELRPVTPAKLPLTRGSARSAEYAMAPDFDALPPEFDEYA